MQPCELARLCRFAFPRDTHTGETTISTSVERGRQRLRVDPPRSNCYLNAGFKCPLMLLAHMGNHGVQYVASERGAIEYIVSYVSKAAMPDTNVLMTLVTKRLAQAALPPPDGTASDGDSHADEAGHRRRPRRPPDEAAVQAQPRLRQHRHPQDAVERARGGAGGEERLGTPPHPAARFGLPFAKPHPAPSRAARIARPLAPPNPLA